MLIAAWLCEQVNADDLGGLQSCFIQDREALRGIIELCGGTLALSSRQAAINIAPEKSEAFAADDSMAASPNILLVRL